MQRCYIVTRSMQHWSCLVVWCQSIMQKCNNTNIVGEAGVIGRNFDGNGRTVTPLKASGDGGLAKWPADLFPEAKARVLWADAWNIGRPSNAA